MPKVNRYGPTSGDFLDFLRMFSSVDAAKRKCVYVNRSENGDFSFAVFPAALSISADSVRYIDVADKVAEIMSESNGMLFSEGKEPRHE